MHRKISDIDKLHATAGRSVGDGYVNVMCHRCGSTSQLLIKNVMTDFVLCPVCREGEINCKARYSKAVPDQRAADFLDNLELYILTSVQPSPN